MSKDLLPRFLPRKLKDHYPAVIGENIVTLEASPLTEGNLKTPELLVNNLDNVLFSVGNDEKITRLPFLSKLRKNFPGLEGKFVLSLDKSGMTTEQLQSRFDRLNESLLDRYGNETTNNQEVNYIKVASKVILSHVEFNLFLGNQDAYGLNDEYKKAILIKYLESARDLFAFEKLVREPGLLERLNAAMINLQHEGYRRPSLDIGQKDENVARLNSQAASLVAGLYQ